MRVHVCADVCEYIYVLIICMFGFNKDLDMCFFSLSLSCVLCKSFNFFCSMKQEPEYRCVKREERYNDSLFLSTEIKF